MNEEWITVIGLFISGIISLLAYVIIKVLRFIKNKYDLEENYDEAIDLLIEGISKAELEFVRTCKSISKDGKLTIVEIEQARHIAWNHAKEMARLANKPVKNIVYSWTESKVNALIDGIVNS